MVQIEKPWWHRVVAHIGYFYMPCWNLPWERVPDLLEEQVDEMAAMAQGYEEEQLTRPIVVPWLVGIEHNSREYSYAMVLEHLSLVGNYIAGIVHELSHSRDPGGVMDIADFKPVGSRPLAEVVGETREMLRHFRHQTLVEVGDQNADARYLNSVFGSLTAYQWMCFAACHQTTHFYQVRHILCRI
jgi:hypothetical protein